MKKLLITLLLSATTAFAVDTLNLTWLQPPGYQSTLFYSTNLNGAWSTFGVVDSPFQVTPTNQQAFFYVVVAPVQAANPIVSYIADPNTEAVKPEFTNQPAMAYDVNGDIGIYFWNVGQQRWN